jgi:hypothetical protein
LPVRCSTTFKVFVGYGGSKAEEVACSLDAFLRKEGLYLFFASPKGHDIPHGLDEEKTKVMIRQNMTDCQIIVFVCHEETPVSNPAKEEIDYILDKHLNNKTILFSKCDDCIPEQAQGLWHPLHFPPEKAEESFCRLLNEIFRSYLRLYAPPRIEHETNGGP